MTASPTRPPGAAPAPWYRQLWPWLLVAGPALVVVAALVTAYVAASGADPVLAEDYYKRGLLVNRTIAAQPPAATPTGAVLRLGADGAVRAELTGPGAAAASTLRLTMTTPSHASARIVALARGADGAYAGRTEPLPPGRWIVTLEGDGWRLPTTVVGGSPADVRLGRAD
jgi:hypothetical protein